MARPVMLLDMDGVLADLERMAVRLFRTMYPDVEPVEGTHDYYLERRYPDHAEWFSELWESEGVFAELDVLPGAEEGVKLLSEHCELYVCTSPSLVAHCLSEKFLWLNWFFPQLTDRLITTRDKTLVRADFLLDDKPDIHGAMQPVWEHLWYNERAGYNWSNIDRILERVNEKI